MSDQTASFAPSHLEGADALALMGGEDGELDAVPGHDLERVGVGGGFGKPHALGGEP